MLTAHALAYAMEEAREQAGCTRACRTATWLSPGGYVIEHTGLGSLDTAVQPVYAEGALDWSESTMTQRLRRWLERLHAHRPDDFNGYAPRQRYG